ncbi:plasmodesmata-located protein 8-like [Phragmites australis]|uniref:plasmodesmata-located protein 8-like n=1 Tax=Phragmites australis TaxID=29695 RepID=UPI002D798552|nr:plasmodesmata-located protein 8-like [Phragmites australis]
MHRRGQVCCSRVAAVLLVVVVIGLGAADVGEAATGTFIYAGCSPSKYQPGTPFEANLNSLLTSIANAAPNGGYNTFTAGANGTGAPGTAAYGLYQCRGDLGNDDCAACVRDALGQLNQVCTTAYAASLQLEGCYVRYDSSNFVGQQDTAMVYRKCSTSTSSDGDFLKNRDAVLGDLQGVTNGYKVSSSGSVQGVAQCLGDLAAADCTTCLAQAVGQLKGTCGTALAADVYLAQCYVRYWANGYYFRPTQDYSQDDVGRTVAIIVGILAGLALFVVFISFLRKTC